MKILHLTRALSMLIFSLLFAVKGYGQLSMSKTDKCVVFDYNDTHIVITPERGDIIRVQAVHKNEKIKPSLTVKLGFVKDDFEKCAYNLTDNGNSYLISTAKAILQVDKNPFRLILKNAKGEILTSTDTKAFMLNEKGSVSSFRMPSDEHFYGFGFMRSTFDARGEKLTWKRAYRWSGATVPYFMSTRNYAYYSNNTFDHTFDFTSAKSRDAMRQSYTVSNTGGQLDFYWLIGDNFKQLLNTYTDLTGKSDMVPKFALGIQYRCRYLENQQGLLKVAKGFRDRDIPIDEFALEPGWEEIPYGDKWQWSKSRFPDPKSMINQLHTWGYHFDLWHSGTAPIKDILNPKVQKDWYAPRLPIIDMGVESFKLDDPYPRSISSQGYDPAHFNKTSIESGQYGHWELVNIANSIYSEAASKLYRKHTNKRALTQFHAYIASVASHRWPYQWGGDFAAGLGMLNAGLSGHPLSSEDMRDFTARGAHYDYLTPVPVLDAWAYYREPWLFGSKLESSHRFYTRFRQKLIPYLYTSLWEAHVQSVPLMRAMVLEYPNDPKTYNLTTEFMLGDAFLVVSKPSYWNEEQLIVAESSERAIDAYLPKGEWINYWTGEHYESLFGKVQKVDWPQYAGGALLVRAGSIIPTGRANRYIDEKPLEAVSLEVYPAVHSTEYSLYEDDGISYDYEKNKNVSTGFSTHQDSENIYVSMTSSKGDLKLMPQQRRYLLKVYSKTLPAQVSNNGNILKQFESRDELIYDFTSGWFYDEEHKMVYIKCDNSWKYFKNDRIERNPSLDFELDDVVYSEKSGKHEKPFDIKIKLDKRPLLNAFFQLDNIPADNLSYNVLCLGKATNAAYPKSISVALDGPVLFANGNKSVTVNSDSLPLSLKVFSGNTHGKVVATTGNDVRMSKCESYISGNPAVLKIVPRQKLLLADGVSKISYQILLQDAQSQTLHIPYAELKLNLSDNVKLVNDAKDIRIKDGRCMVEVMSTNKEGIVKIDAECEGIKTSDGSVEAKKGRLMMYTNPDQEVLTYSGSDKVFGCVKWLPNQVVVSVKFMLGDKEIKGISPRDVHLKVLDTNRKQLAEYTAKSEDGEALFQNVDYYQKGGNYYFVVESEGYEPIEKRIFDNTWNMKYSKGKFYK